MKKVFGAIAALAAGLMLFSCSTGGSSSGGGKTIEGVQLTQGTIARLADFNVGDEVPLAAELVYSDGSTEEIDPDLDDKLTFKQTAGTAHAVLTGYVLSAKAAGTADIKLLYDMKYSKPFTVTVKGAAVDTLTGVVFSDTNTSVAINGTVTLSLKGIYSISGTKDVAGTFSVDDSSLASVSGNVLTGKKAGTVKVTGFFEGKSVSKNIEVYEFSDKELESITVEPSDITLSNSGDKATITVTAYFTDGTHKDVSDVAVCTPSTNDVGLMSGNVFTSSACYADTVVTVTVNYSYKSVTKTKTVDITVKKNAEIKKLESIKVSASSTTVSVGGTVTLSTKATFSNGDESDVLPSYSLSNSNANISGSTLTGVANGSVTVTASYTYEGITKTDSVNVTVSESNDGNLGIGFSFN